MFIPPRRLHHDLERDFLHNYAHRFAVHRQAVVILGIITWFIYFGWILFFANRSELFLSKLPLVITIRFWEGLF